MYLWLLQFSLQFILHSETRHCMAHMHLQNCKIRIVFFCYVMLFKNHEYAISIENNPYYSLLVICVVVLLNLFFMFSFTFSANTITTSSVGFFFFHRISLQGRGWDRSITEHNWSFQETSTVKQSKWRDISNRHCVGTLIWAVWGHHSHLCSILLLEKTQASSTDPSHF